jgi:hypothetical protein
MFPESGHPVEPNGFPLSRDEKKLEHRIILYILKVFLETGMTVFWQTIASPLLEGELESHCHFDNSSTTDLYLS